MKDEKKFTSKYKGVSTNRSKPGWWIAKIIIDGVMVHVGTYKGDGAERIAALAIDKTLIRAGKEPVNILRRK